MQLLLRPFHDYQARFSLLKTAVFCALFVPALYVASRYPNGGLGARPLTDSDRRDIESTMRKILGAGAQAAAAFRSTRVIPSSVGGAIEGTLTLNGRSQPVRLQLTSPAPGRYRGAVTIVQSAFGIKPYTGFFGALKLRDEVVAEFEVDLGPAA